MREWMCRVLKVAIFEHSEIDSRDFHAKTFLFCSFFLFKTNEPNMFIHLVHSVFDAPLSNSFFVTVSIACSFVRYITSLIVFAACSFDL